MKGDFDWTAPATLLLFVGREGDGEAGFVPIHQGTVTEAVAFYARCSDWVMRHCRLVVPGAMQVGGYDIGDLADRLHHAN